MGRRVLVAVAVVALVATACSSRGEDASGAGGSSEATTTSAVSAAGDGDFGDLTAVCGPDEGGGGVPSGGADETQGVAEGTLTVGTIADPGFTGRPGLNQEIFDTATAFVDWCNAAGGINGRQLELNLHDAKLTEYATAIAEACAQDFAVVGDGAVQDNLWASSGPQCGLIDLPAFSVTTTKGGDAGRDLVEARAVQAVPSSADRFQVGPFLQAAEEFPDAVAHTGILYADLDTLVEQKDKTVAALEQLDGFEVVNTTSYNVLGEANWAPLAQALEDDGVRFVHFVGEPQNLSALLQAMDEIDYQPDAIVQATNFYDQSFVDSAGATADGVLIQSSFVPFEEAADSPAMQQYLDLVEASDGKVAQLGAQAMSAWLFFATAAKACDLEGDLTRTCVLEHAAETTEWTGGGLHGPTDPSSNSPTPCFLLMEVRDGGFARHHPDEGYDCDEGNVVDIDIE